MVEFSPSDQEVVGLILPGEGLFSPSIISVMYRKQVPHGGASLLTFLYKIRCLAVLPAAKQAIKTTEDSKNGAKLHVKRAYSTKQRLKVFRRLSASLNFSDGGIIQETVA